MRIIEPSRPLVVEIGQGPRLQDRSSFWADRDDFVGIARHHLDIRSTRSGGFNHTSRNSLSCLAFSAIAIALEFAGICARWHTRHKAFRKGKRLESR